MFPCTEALYSKASDVEQLWHKSQAAVNSLLAIDRDASRLGQFLPFGDLCHNGSDGIAVDGTQILFPSAKTFTPDLHIADGLPLFCPSCGKIVAAQEVPPFIKPHLIPVGRQKFIQIEPHQSFTLILLRNGILLGFATDSNSASR